MRIDASDLADLRPLIRVIVEETIAALDGERDRLAYTEKQAAELFGVASHKLRDARRRGELRGRLVGKTMVYTRSELLRFLSSDK